MTIFENRNTNFMFLNTLLKEKREIRKRVRFHIEIKTTYIIWSSDPNAEEQRLQKFKRTLDRCDW